MATTNATYTSPDWRHYKYPLSISPIPDSMRRGMIVLCTITLVSCLTTLSLITYLSYRFFTGRKNHGNPLHKNQYMLLIYSLVLADFQLDLGFLLDVMWLNRGEIVAPSAGCVAQGWLLNFGDLASGLFVLAIACHTFLTVVYGRKILLRAVCWSIVSLWALAAVLTVIPIGLHPRDIFVAQGSWVRIVNTSAFNRLPYLGLPLNFSQSVFHQREIQYASSLVPLYLGLHRPVCCHSHVRYHIYRGSSTNGQHPTRSSPSYGRCCGKWDGPQLQSFEGESDISCHHVHDIVSPYLCPFHIATWRWPPLK
jgi:hypothetical protein